MKRFFVFLLLLSVAFAGHAQQSVVIANKVRVKDSIEIGGKWYSKLPDSLSGGSGTDTAALLKKDTAAMLAVYFKIPSGSIADYMRGDGSLAMADTSMIPLFYKKVK